MLSGIDLLFTIPFSIWSIITWFPVQPWPGWTTLHADFSRIDKYSATIWRNDIKGLAANETSRWIGVAYGFLFFIFFGFTDEARRHYRLAFQAVFSKLGYQKASSVSAKYVFTF
jgi:pheromone a factor receptor